MDLMWGLSQLWYNYRPSIWRINSGIDAGTHYSAIISENSIFFSSPGKFLLLYYWVFLSSKLSSFHDGKLIKYLLELLYDMHVIPCLSFLSSLCCFMTHSIKTPILHKFQQVIYFSHFTYKTSFKAINVHVVIHPF